MDQPKLNQSHYDIARDFLEDKIEETPDDSRLHSALGITYASLGLKEAAVREGELGVELLPVSKEAWKGAYRLEDLSQIYAMVGKHDAAINHLETLLNIPSDLSVILLQLDPKWDPLREHPRFISLLQKHGA